MLLPVAPLAPELPPKLVPPPPNDPKLEDPVAPEAPLDPKLLTEADPILLDPDDPIPPPPVKIPFAYNCSINGSYQNSHVSYVVCWFGFRIESPDFAGPTP